MTLSQRDHDEVGSWLARNRKPLKPGEILVLYVHDPGTTHEIHSQGQRVVVAKSESPVFGWYKKSHLYILSPNGGHLVKVWRVSNREHQEAQNMAPIETIYDAEGNYAGEKMRRMTDEELAAAGMAPRPKQEDQTADAAAQEALDNVRASLDGDASPAETDISQPETVRADRDSEAPSGPGTTKSKSKARSSRATRTATPR